MPTPKLSISTKPTAPVGPLRSRRGVLAWVLSLLPGSLLAVRGGQAHAQAESALVQLKTLPEVLRGLGARSVLETTQLELTVPDVADQGAMVPVTVRSTLAQTDQITLLVLGNPVPWVATYDLLEGMEPWVSMRIKMSQSADVMVVARAQGRFYAVRRAVRVTQGGCGA